MSVQMMFLKHGQGQEQEQEQGQGRGRGRGRDRGRDRDRGRSRDRSRARGGTRGRGPHNRNPNKISCNPLKFSIQFPPINLKLSSAKCTESFKYQIISDVMILDESVSYLY